MEAIVLSGGFATRLYPLTLSQAKSLIEIGGRPAIEHVLDWLKPLGANGLDRAVIVSNSRFVADFRASLADRTWSFRVDVMDNGVKTEADKRGAVGDMAFGASRLSGEGPFLVVAGDNLCSFDSADLHADFVKTGFQSCVVTHRLREARETRGYNNLRIDSNGRVLDFTEKPDKPWSSRFATCIYFFPGDVRQDLQAFVAEDHDPDKAGDFIQWLCQRRTVRALEGHGAWFDIGSLDGIALADAFYKGSRHET